MTSPTAPRRLWQMPPMGGDPEAIVQFCHRHVWDQYAQVRRPWLRQVEENVRALCGQQFDTYIDSLGQFVDLSAMFAPNDERWRRQPVFNYLGQHWYQSALAKLTENVPILGAMPATADQADAATAQIFDPVFKYEWAQMRMPERLFKCFGWLLASGRFVLKMRWDPDRGPMQSFYGPATLQLGGQERQLTDAPYCQQADGSFGPAVTEGDDEEPQYGQAHRQRLGDLCMEVVSPTSVLLPYGPELPNEKPWVMHEYLAPLDDVEARFGVSGLEPDQHGSVANDLLLKMEYTSTYGMPSSPGGGFGLVLPSAQDAAFEGLVRVRERWERDCPLYPEGRLTISTRTKLLYDEANPYIVPGVQDRAVLPFYVFDKPGFPFRQEGSSDLEALIPVARADNRTLGGLMDANDFNNQPTLLINKNWVGDDQDDKFNVAGGRVYSDGPLEGSAKYLQPPKLPESGLELHGLLQQMMALLGHSDESQGTVANDARSGELLQQDRFNQDRPWGATLRLFSYVWENVGQDMMTMLGVCMEDDRVLAIAGEDNAAQFITVRPDLFQGRINVRCQPESAVLESRQDKQQRLTQMLMAAAQLRVAAPDLAQVLLDNMGFPDATRALRPGGQAYSLAVRQLAEMQATGQLSPILPEQDHGTHIKVVTDFMQTRNYRDLDPAIQQVLRIYRMLHQAAGAEETIKSTQLAAGVAAKQGIIANQAQQAIHPALGLGPHMDPANQPAPDAAAA